MTGIRLEWRDAMRGWLIAGLIVANLAAVGLHVELYRRYRRTPWALAAGLWTYGPIGLFRDGDPAPIRLSDPATFHATCGPDCAARKGGAL